MTTTYNWATDATTVVSNVNVDLIYPVGTSFSVVTTCLIFPQKGSMGIKVTDGTNNLYYSVGPMAGPNVISPESNMVLLALQWNNTDHLIKPYCSEDGITWVLCEMPIDENTGLPMPYPTFTAPTQAGIFFFSGDPALMETVVFGSPRVLVGPLLVAGTDPGTFQIPEASETLKPIGTVPLVPPDIETFSEEAVVHALVGAPFGDLEFDVGKSVGWLTRFVDDTFVTDVNIGSQRNWVVNWSKSFDYVYYKFSGIDFFTSPVNYRKGQVTDAMWYSDHYPDKLAYDDNDWVIFLDAHEGLSVDNSSFPDDFLIAPYKSFIYREIARANAAGRDRIVIPFFIYLNHKHVQNASQSYINEGVTRTVTQSVGVPYYLPYQGLTRMFKASVIKNPSFNWALLDTPVAIPDATVKIQVVSYAYAHWQLQDVPPGQTSVPPLSASNDLGWQQRCAITQVLPVTGLPVGSAANPVGTWKDPVAFPDPAGFRGPWAFDTYSWHITDPVIPNPPPAIASQVAGVRTPMYDLFFRLNVRDGVWYDTDALGNSQMVWDDTAQDFVPWVPPAA